MLVQGLRKVGTSNPLILLDELDKVGTSSFHGDPSAALLETLDPAQNWSFHDQYVGGLELNRAELMISYLGDVTIDLSQVMFIATANSLDTISPPLLDRCEVIECSGYVTDEKLAIAKKFLLPRQIKECGMEDGKVQLGDEALLRVILDYTQEVRIPSLDLTDGRLA
jgi:ATP-dependent Lon protease